MTVCPSCGFQNVASKRFCTNCGAPLPRGCPSCGAPVEPGERFCGECGAPLEAAAPREVPEPQRSLPVAERRLVSVLFADLVGFTTLSEVRDAEEVRELLTRYFDTARRVIERYGGTVEKFIGDAVMAVWGTPIAQEDDAERAVRAALDMVDAVSAVGDEVNTPSLRARVGVLTGEAAVNLRAHGEGMVAGDLVNTASRIQAAAAPGTVLVGSSTRRATEAAVVYEDAGVHQLKGKVDALALHRALRVVAARGGAQRSGGLEAPFVGRDRELRLIKDLFHDSADARRAHLVSVIGVAGVGKSRLSWEFEKYIDGLVETVWWHRGRCLAYGEGVAYWPLVEMVKMRARIAENEDAASAAAKLHQTVEAHLSDPAERTWIEPRLVHLLGLKEAASATRDDLFAAWRLFFERLAEANAVVMVFEDMQWADPSLVAFIEYLLEWSRGHRILVLTSGRPEFLERHPAWGTGKRNFTSLSLEPLPAGGMRELMNGLVPGLPPDLTEQILARAEGIPLYAVETVRMLLDRGLLEGQGAVYTPTGPIDALEVPESLHGLIAARLDGLTSDERRLVQDASVLGKTFLKEGLAAVSGLGSPQLGQLLASLVRKEILSVQADARSPERGQYGFLQDLVKKVAYETLSRRDRKARHLAAASFIEAEWAGEEEEVVEVVASHYIQAYEADPGAPDVPQIKRKASSMLIRAAERASSLAAAGEALRYFEQVIAMMDDALEQAELHERAGREAWKAGRAEPARYHYEAAIETFDRLGLTHPSARAAAALSTIEFSEGRLERAVARIEPAVGALASEEPDADLATASAELARLYYFTGQPELALDYIERALAIAESLRLFEVLSQALQTKGNILAALGRMEEAIALVRAAVEIAVEQRLSAPALRGYLNLCATLIDVDRLQEAQSIVERGLELSRRVGDRFAEARMLGNGAWLAFVLGRWSEAESVIHGILEGLSLPEQFLLEVISVGPLWIRRDELDEAERILALIPGGGSSPDAQTRTTVLDVEAELDLARGGAAASLARAEKAYEGRGELGIVNVVVKEALVRAIEAAFALNDLDAIERLLAEIDALRPGELTPYLRAHGARAAARLAAKRNDDASVASAFDAAAALFRDIGMRFWFAVVLLEHAEWLRDTGRAEEVDPLLAEAREIFAELRARPWLDRLATSERRAPVA